MSYHEKTSAAAKGQWSGILQHLGMPASFLKRQNGPCPFCGGKDRFRFSNLDGAGTWFCNQCGSGAGMEMVMRLTGAGFAEAASRVDDILGNVKFEAAKVRREVTDEEKRAACMALWRETRKAEPGDLVHRYLDSRGIGCDEMPTSLRLHPALRDGEGGIRPAMVARVTGPDGAGVTLHRTFLRPDGLAKAEMASPRKLMPGTLPEGACVRLSTPSDALCLAEGIETALAVERLFETPCWATISAGTMAKWIAPDGVESVTICADNDAHFAGQSAAYLLANRLAAKGLAVNVRVPDRPGEDWLDVLNRKGDAA